MDFAHRVPGPPMSLSAPLSLVLCVAAIAVVALPSSVFAVDFTDIYRSSRTQADRTLDASYWYTNDYDDDRDDFAGAGGWTSSIESRVAAYEGAPDGIGRVRIDSRVEADQVAFSSRIFVQGGEFSTSGGDPEDVGSYYYTNEYTSGLGRSELRLQFNLYTDTPYSISLSSPTGPIDSLGSVGVSLSYRQLLPIPLPVPAVSVFDYASLLAAPTAGQQSGILPAGRYALSINHESASAGALGLDVLFIVPEPGTAVLLGLGLLGLSSARPRVMG